MQIYAEVQEEVLEIICEGRYSPASISLPSCGHLMDFEVITDSSLLDLGIADGINPSGNKRLISIINDFEDKKWRQDKFDSFVWDNVAETALTHKEREALQNHPQSLLINAAKNLRLTDADDDIGKGSELAEIVLYGIMRRKYGALPVVPKIFYKQNVQDNAKGAESVHIVIGTNKDFSLWFGEAKFYTSIADARLGSIIASVKNSLATEKLKKENAIIVSLQELDNLEMDPEIRNHVKESLSNKLSIDSIKSKIVIPILLLHECPITAGVIEMTPDYVNKIRQYHNERAVSYFKKQIHELKDIFKYAEIRFHLILFPVPQKQPIIDKFLQAVQFYKG